MHEDFQPRLSAVDEWLPIAMAVGGIEATGAFAGSVVGTTVSYATATRVPAEQQAVTTEPKPVHFEYQPEPVAIGAGIGMLAATSYLGWQHLSLWRRNHFWRSRQP